MAVITLTAAAVDDTLAMTSFDSLTDGSWASSAAYDNTSNDYIAITVGGMIDTGTVTTDGTIDIYLASSFDGTNYTSGLDGADAGVTWGTTPSTSHTNGFNNLPLLVSIDVDAADDDQVYEWGPFEVSVGAAVPTKFCIVIQNNVGDTIGADAANKISVIGYTATST